MNFQRLTFGLLLTLALTFLVQGSALAAKKTAPAEVAVEETVLRGEVKLVSSANKFNRTYFKLNEYPVLIFVEETTEFANPSMPQVVITPETAVLIEGKAVEVEVRHVPEKGILATKVTILAPDRQYQVREEAVRANKPKLQVK